VGDTRPAPDGGLINQTWLVGAGPDAVLQWVNPIFAPTVHCDLAALSGRLASRGVPTPVLLPTPDGRAWLVDPAGGSWRLTSFLPGTTQHRLRDTNQAHSAGALVGQFHAAVAGWQFQPLHVRPGAHDTERHISALLEAIEQAQGHPLEGPATSLGLQIAAAWQTWQGELDLPQRVCHGDLKVSNLRFSDDGTVATGLLDLDTLSLLPLAVELGDAWRSWCNRAGEDDPAASAFALDLFEASARGWMNRAPVLSGVERDSLAPGIERICLELAARFCGDALRNSYFREDRERWPVAGAHNLTRAQGQMRLAISAREHVGACHTILSQARVD
jgi:Phosphotransferase enzyme family